jgi:hypothetical protein
MARPAYSELGGPRLLTPPYSVYLVPLAHDSRTLYTLPNGQWIHKTLPRKIRTQPEKHINANAHALLASEQLVAITAATTPIGEEYYLIAWLAEQPPIPARLVGHSTATFLPTLNDALQTRLLARLPAGIITPPTNLDHRTHHGHGVGGFSK